MGDLIEELEAKLEQNIKEYDLKWKEFLHLRRLSTTSDRAREEKRRVESQLSSIDRKMMRIKYEINAEKAKIEPIKTVIVPITLPKILVSRMKILADKSNVSLSQYIQEILEIRTVVQTDNTTGGEEWKK